MPFRALPLALLVASVGCSGIDVVPPADAGAGAGGAGMSGGSSGSGAVGGGGSAGALTGGTGTGGAIAGAPSGGTGGAIAGAGAGGSSGATTGGSAGVVNGGAGSGGMNPGGAGVGGAVSGGSGGNAGKGGSAGAGGGGRGGSAGASGSGGAGGASGFNPCPATGACKILPLGDSITDGIGVTGGGSYRIELFRLALGGGKQITYVGGSMNGPTMVDGQPFPRAHEGHSGWTIAQIDGITPSPALTPDPHIILLHIGTNDMVGSPAGAPGRLATLIDQITMDLPNSLLVVAKIIPLSNSGAVTTFNNALPALIDARASMGRHVILVDQFTGFPTSELADGVHPNAAGYARMARVWYTAISSYLH